MDEAAVFGVVNHGVWVGVRSQSPPFHRRDGEKVLECHLDQDGIAMTAVDPFRERPKPSGDPKVGQDKVDNLVVRLGGDSGDPKRLDYRVD